MTTHGKQRRFRGLIIAAVCFACGLITTAVYFGSLRSVQDSKRDEKSAVSAHLRIMRDVVGSLDVGIGWNDSASIEDRWHSFLKPIGSWTTQLRSEHDFTHSDRDRFFDLMEWSGTHWLRHAISISDWEPVNDDDNPERMNLKGFKFESEQMQRHYLFLDQMEKRGIKVLLANWDLGARWLTKYKGNWRRAHPDNEDEFAEALASLVYHLKRVKKYQCVWAVSLWNEPNLTYSNNGHKARYPDTFWSLYQTVDRHLRRLGVRDDILLLGPETSTDGSPEHIARMLKKYGPILDIIADHDYFAFRGNQMDRSVSAYDRLMRDVEKQYGKKVPVVITEFGNYGNGAGPLDDDKGVYEGALSTTAYLIRMINIGTAGLARWEFLIYGKKWRNFGALTISDPEYVFRPYGPVYYTHAITARYLRPSWKARKLQIDGIDQTLEAAALTSGNGDDMTILLLNDDRKAVPLRLTLDALITPRRFHYLSVTGPVPQCIKQSDDLMFDGNRAVVMLPPKSIVVLTTLEPGNLELPKQLALTRSRQGTTSGHR